MRPTIARLPAPLRPRRPRTTALGIGAAPAVITGTGAAGAQEPAEAIADLTSAIDAAWLMIAAVLVLCMQAGFALVEAALIRSKRVTNILVTHLLDVSVGAVAYWAVGFGLASGVSGTASALFGNGHFFLAGAVTDYPTWFFEFEFAFAATAAATVSGAMAERTKRSEHGSTRS